MNGIGTLRRVTREFASSVLLSTVGTCNTEEGLHQNLTLLFPDHPRSASKKQISAVTCHPIYDILLWQPEPRQRSSMHFSDFLLLKY